MDLRYARHDPWSSRIDHARGGRLEAKQSRVNQTVRKASATFDSVTSILDDAGYGFACSVPM